MSKKLNGFEDLGNFVFSTNPNAELNQQESIETLNPEKQNLEAHFSNKGRGGKIVTIIKGFEGTKEDLKVLAKMLKTKCSVGGTVKDGEIVIQGNYRDKIMTILKNENYNVKRIGG